MFLMFPAFFLLTVISTLDLNVAMIADHLTYALYAVDIVAMGIMLRISM